MGRSSPHDHPARRAAGARPGAGRAEPALARLDPSDAAAALGVSPAALSRGEEPLDPEEASAAELIRLHAGVDGLEEPPPSSARLIALVAEGRPRARELCRAIEAERRVAAAVLARAGMAPAGLDRGEGGRPGGARHLVAAAVVHLGEEESARVAAAWSLKPLATCPLAVRGSEQAPLWALAFRRAAVTARLAGALAASQRLAVAGHGAVAGPDRGAGPAYAAGLLGALGGAAALRSLAALSRDGTLPPFPRRTTLRVVRLAQAGLDTELRRAWGFEAAAPAGERRAEAGQQAWGPPIPWLIRLAAALDGLGEGPGADPRAAAEAAEAADRLGMTPAGLAAAVVRHQDAAAWVERWIAGG